MPAKAPKNIKVAIIPCAAAFHGCTAPADAAAEAAKALGWTVTQYDGGGDQQKQNAAMLDAVSAGSNLILLMAIGSIAMWVAVPVAWLWLGSKLQDGSSPELGPYLVVIAGIPVYLWLKWRQSRVLTVPEEFERIERPPVAGPVS